MDVPCLYHDVYKIIFSYISDNTTYKNARISCKMFHSILKDLKIFHNNQLSRTIKFNNFTINIYDSKNVEIGYLDKMMGKFTMKYKNWNTNIDFSNPYRVKVSRNNMYNYEIIGYNLIEDTKEKKVINIPRLNCIIS